MFRKCCVEVFLLLFSLMWGELFTIPVKLLECETEKAFSLNTVLKIASNILNCNYVFADFLQILTERERWQRKHCELNRKGSKGNPEPAAGLWQLCPKKEIQSVGMMGGAERARSSGQVTADRSPSWSRQSQLISCHIALICDCLNGAGGSHNPLISLAIPLNFVFTTGKHYPHPTYAAHA